MIHAEGLQWGVPGRPLTPPLDLQLRAGSLTAVVGANGCGKSSLLRVLAGLAGEHEGSVSIDGGGCCRPPPGEADDRPEPERSWNMRQPCRCLAPRRGNPCCSTPPTV